GPWRRGTPTVPRPRWPRSSRWPATWTGTACSTRCGPACSLAWAVTTRPGKPASGRSRWPATRPNASSSPAACRSEPCPLARAPPTSLCYLSMALLHLDHGPDLDRHPALVHPGPGLGDLDGLLDGVGVEHRVPAERLLGLHERAVGDAAGAHRLGRGRRGELVAGLDELAGTAAALLVPGADLGVPLLAFGLGHALRRFGVQQQDHVFHGLPPGSAGAPIWRPFIYATNGAAPDPTPPRKKFQVPAAPPLAVSLASTVSTAS